MILQKITTLFIVLLFSGLIFGQAVDLPITVTDNGTSGNSQITNIGLDPTATDGIDGSLGEAALPPPPPTGVFDARLILPDGTTESYADYRNGTQYQIGQYTYRVTTQVEAGATEYTVAWVLPTGVTGTLQDPFGGAIVNETMTGTGSYTVTNTALDELLMIMDYDLLVAPDVPTLTSPADGATNQALATTFQWSAGGTVPVDTYRLEVATDAGFTTLVYDQSGLTATSQLVNLTDYNTTHYWRVTATNSKGSATSAEWSFTTVPDLPSVPTLNFPADGTTNVPNTLTFDWNTSTNAAWYTIEVATDAGFTSIEYSDTSLSTSEAVTLLLNSQVYYWRVTAHNISGTAVSAEWSFTTSPPTPAAPTLTAPTDGATDVALAPTFTWNASSGATEYQIQVADDAGFTNIVIDQSGITTPTFTAGSNLNTSTQYWWRVYAINGNGTSPGSTEWSFTTVPPAPGTPTLVAPLNGAVNLNSNVTFDWDPVAGADTYELIYNGTTISGIPSTTTQQTLTLTDNTVYNWTVTAVNAGGSAVSAEWTFTTAPAAPTAVTLLTPTDGAIDQSLTPTLDWEDATGAFEYQVEVATDAGFTTIIVDSSGISISELALTGLSTSTQYFWRVTASNGNGSVTSAEWDFTTVPPGPGAFTLVTPADFSTNQPVNSLLFEWTVSNLADTYTIEIATDGGFNDIVYTQSGLTGTTHTVSGLQNNQHYYWHVIAYNVAGNYGSPVWEFTTIIATPAVPTLVSPADGSADISINPSLTWNAVTGAATYHLQVATDAGFTNIVFDDNTLTDTTQTVGPLSYLTQYFWRVQAENTGGSSGFTAEWDFTTVIESPAAPTLVAPADGAVDQPTTLGLVWNSALNADTYSVEVATDAGFTNIVASFTGLTDTTQQVTALANSTQHFWRVTAANNGGTATSVVWDFTTIIALPLEPTLVSPADGATGIPVSPTLVWNAVTGAATYHLQVATDVAFTNIVYIDSTLTGTSQAVGTLLYNNVYFWRVQAKNAAGTSGFSSSWSFTTQFESISTPTNLLASTMPNEIKKVYLSWTDNATTETGYYVERKLGDSTSTVEGTYAVIDTLTADAVAYVDTTNLQDTTVYTYRVQAFNADTLSAYSNQAEVQTLIPVELTSFTAAASGTNISVNWETATETNNKGFEVERNLIDDPKAEGWKTIGYIEGTGTTVQTSVYSFTDELKYVSYKGTIQYRLKQIDNDGTFYYVDPVEVDVDFTPTEFSLYQNYPNPFNPATTIKFALPEKADVTVIIYNQLGEKVTELFSGTLESGYHELNWDASSMTSGVYIYQLHSTKYSSVKKMLLLK